MTADRRPVTAASDHTAAIWLIPAVWFLAGVCVGGILALTLMPGEPAPYTYLADIMEPWLGPRRVVVLLNILLFVPLGIVLGFVGRLRLLLLAPVASIGIELLQWIVPERNPDPWDVIANSTGAAAGYLMAAAVRHARLWWVTRRRTRPERA